MDPGGTQCPARRGKRDIWDMMKTQYEDRAATLQAKEEELKLRIAQMESLLSSRLSESCCCTTSNSNTVPKVFPRKHDSPVRDVPKSGAPASCVTVCLSSERVSPARQRSTSRRTTPATTSPHSPSRSESPKKQPNPPTFFQKVMENAKSILTLKCSAVPPALDERPTRENDVVAYSSNLEQKKSNCSCDFDEETTRIDFTESTYSQDVSNTFCCKTCNLDSMNTIRSRKTTSAMVNTYTFCNTSTSTDNKAVAEDGSQYIPSDFSADHTQNISISNCWVCPASKSSRKSQNCSTDSSKKQQSCNNKTCASFASLRRRQSHPSVTFKECDSVRKQRSKSQIKEVDIQCAFIGSPMLNAADYAAPNKVIVPQVNQDGDKSRECTFCNPKPAPPQEQNITVTDMASKEKEIRNQIENLQDREKNYDNLFNDYQSMMNRPPCCCCQPRGQDDKINKISQELRLENKVLKDELMQMKMELKHCLEKVEGPMKSQLETEKMRCVQLEQELNFASKNMLVNQDTHMREMNALKLQLCMACSNINELNSVNRRLKDEMASLDGMCTKLEDDLMKQKISEAETIKLLKKRRGETHEGICTCSKTGVQEKFSCDSNLHVIARKLSKTLKESEPCEECAKLPAELTGAAKCIKDLSDLVESRKVKRMELEEPTQKPKSKERKKVASSQAPPETMDEGSQAAEGQRGDEAKTTTILAPVLLQEQLSSEIEVKISSMEPAPTDTDIGDKPPTESLFFSAAGEPLVLCPEICDQPCPPTCDTNQTCLKQGKSCQDKQPKIKRVPTSVSEVIKEIEKVVIEDRIEEEIPKESGEGQKIPIETGKGPRIHLDTEEIKKVPVGKGEEVQETPAESGETVKTPTEVGEPKKSVEKTIEEGMTKQPVEFLRPFQPPPCTKPCGDDEPCAKGQPCFMIRKRGDVPQEATRIPTATSAATPIAPGIVMEVKISETVDTTLKPTIPPDAVIEPPKIMVEEPPHEKEILEKTVLLEESTISTPPTVPESGESDQVESYEITDFTTGPTISEIPTDKPSEKAIETPKVDVKVEPEEKVLHETAPVSITKVPVPGQEGVEAPSAPLYQGEMQQGIMEEQVAQEPDHIKSTIDQPGIRRTQPESVVERRSELPPIEELVGEPQVAVLRPRILLETAPPTGPSSEQASKQQIPPSSAIEKPSVTFSEIEHVMDRVFEITDVEEEAPVIPKPSSAMEKPSVTITEPLSEIDHVIDRVVEVTQTAKEPSPKVKASTTEKVPTTPSVSTKMSAEERRLDASSPTPPPSIRVPTFTVDQPFIEERTGNFPFEVDTKVEILDVPPPDVHVTTTITASGTLEVITEGPEALIETTLVYEPDGTIQVVTHVTEEESKMKEDKSSSVRISPDPTSVLEPTKGAGVDRTLPKIEQDSMISGMTDVTGLETVTESTKETTLVSSFPSVIDPTMAANETVPSSMVTMGPTLDDKTSDMRGTSSMGETTSVVTSSKTPSVGMKAGISKSACCEQGAETAETREEIAAKFREIVEEEIMHGIPSGIESKKSGLDGEEGVKISGTITEGMGKEATSKAPSIGVELGTSKMQCCEEDAAARAGVEGKSTMECCQEAVSGTGMDATSGTEEVMRVIPSEIEPKKSALDGEKGVKISGTITEGMGKEAASKTPSIGVELGTSKMECCEENAAARAGVEGKSTMECCREAASATSGTEEVMRVIPGEIGIKESGLSDVKVVKFSERISEQATDKVVGEVEKTKRSEGKSEVDRVAGETAQQALTGQKRDCGCQATPQAEQSCQCCECKDVGVSTSRDSETLTDDNMVQADVSLTLEAAHNLRELGPESQLSAAPSNVSGSSRDIAEAVNVDSGQMQGTTDEVSTIHEGPSSIQEPQSLRDEPKVGTKGSKTAKGEEYKDKQDPQSLRDEPKGGAKDSKIPKDGEYKNKRGKIVKDTECACSEVSEDEEVSTADRAAQCECNGPIEKDDRSEGRPSSGSEADKQRSHKKKPHDEPGTKMGKPVKTIHPVKSKGEDDEIVAHLEPDAKKDKHKKQIEPLQPEGHDIDHKEAFSDSSIAKDKPKKMKSARSEDSDQGKPFQEREKEPSDADVPTDKSKKGKPVKSEDDIDEKKSSHHKKEPSPEPDSTKDKSKRMKPAKSEDEVDQKSSHSKKEPSPEPDSTKHKSRKARSVKSEDDIDQQKPSNPKKEKRPSPEPDIKKDKTKRVKPKKSEDFSEEEEPSQIKEKEDDDDEEKSSSESIDIPGKGKKKKFEKKDSDKDKPPKFRTKKVPPKPKPDDDSKTKSLKTKPKDIIEDFSDETLSSDTGSEFGMPDKSLEVPDSTVLPPSDIKDSKRPRKKRSSSQRLQNIECDCPGVCQCVICSPKIIAERKALTGSPSPPTGDKGRPCWCSRPPGAQAVPTAPPSQIPQSVSKPPPQTPKSFAEDLPVEKKEHPTGCQCVNCLCEPCTPCPPQYGQEAFLRSTNLTSTQTVTPKNKKRISVEDVFGPSEDVLTECRIRIECQKAERASHPPNCECVDCLCLPKIKRIAELREHPIIRDEKQVYQVKCYCENTRKPVSTSRIPIATYSTTGPPKAKSSISCTCGDCKCTPCSDINQASKKSSSSQQQPKSETSPAANTSEQRSSPLQMTLSELAKLCDCKTCKCAVCFDKPPKKAEESVSTTRTDKPGEKKSSKNCCCTGDCTCAVCPVDQMAKRTADTQKLDTSSPSAPADGGRSLTPKIQSLYDKPEDCDCEECICPHSKALRSESSISLGHPDDCDCDDCFCPNAKARLGKTDSKMKTAASAKNLPPKTSEAAITPKPSRLKPEGCVCGQCACPGKEAALRATGDTSQMPPDCTCSICACPGKELVTKITSPSAAPQSAPPPPSARQGQVASMPAIPEGSSIADCDCVDCQCSPCADPKRRKGTSGIAPCDCPDCKCEPCADPSKRKDKGDASDRLVKGEVGMMARSAGQPIPVTASAGVGPTENKATHPPDCICNECLCHPEEHPQGCSCPECKCVDCYAKKMDTAVHAEGCQCNQCICAPCTKETKAETPSKGSGVPRSVEAKPSEPTGDCTCDICKCVDCFNKPKHGGDCSCADCICIDCPKKGAIGKPVKPKSVPQDAPAHLLVSRSCHCLQCVCDVCTSPSAPKEARSTGRAPGCTCEVCQCSDCGNTAHPANLTDKDCTCIVCQCDECVVKRTEAPKQPIAAVRSNLPRTQGGEPVVEGSPIEEKTIKVTSPFTDPPPFEVPIRKHCTNKKCKCPECEIGNASVPQSGKRSNLVPLATAEAPPFEVPVHKACTCVKCDCIDCNKQAGTTRSTTTGDMQSTTQQGTSTSFAFRKICTCQRCDCDSCNPQGTNLTTAVSFGASPPSPSPPPVSQSGRSVPAPAPAAVSTMTKCECPTCTCPEDAIKAQATPATGFQGVTSKSTGLLAQEDHPVGCSCPKCCACPVKMASSQVRKEPLIEEEIIKISQMDNETLLKRIQTDKKENCKCKEQMKEIRQALDKIKCSCSEAEMKAMRNTSAKPFVKKGSTFGQTMSGLKFALHNLQEKCKAKDKLIEAMTGELKTRTSSNTFERVLNSNANVEAPDYDKANDISSFERSPDNTTNILFAGNEEREIGHTNVQQKTSGHKHKRKSKVCKCGKQHKEKANSKVDLSGFEVVDIRRITQDSIIIKWKPPQSNLVTGYDIFVNGVNKSKVMSGGRTSAMVHSLDLSSTIQITIYAVTKCGRCEPPAIAIYEINS